MYIQHSHHLTYCTNIHPGESWTEVFASLRRFAPALKAALSPSAPFGLGLRLSNRASIELGLSERLEQFRAWLQGEGLYVFTMNGFPYGGFHGRRVKEQVHQPDWTTPERVNYTQRLFRQLAALLPEGLEGGISTSPLSYKPWLPGDSERAAAFERAVGHILSIVDFLQQHEQERGQYLHLDIEPEPDGLLENSREVVEFFERRLLPRGVDYFAPRFRAHEAEAIVRRYVNLCYDVCHFAVAYESPAETLRRFSRGGIRIGKVQISAALKLMLPTVQDQREAIRQELRPFNESTYLHQVVARDSSGRLLQYPDLPPALLRLHDTRVEEWRCHFHVPIFLEDYGSLRSTQSDIIEILDIQRSAPFTRHLEVETYTWEVLPPDLRGDLLSSIEREMRWALERLNPFQPR
jgi:hypothetical protein